MAKRVIPEADPLTVGARTTWAAYLPKALVEELKRGAREDGFRSASAYAEALLVFALRRRHEEREADERK